MGLFSARRAKRARRARKRAPRDEEFTFTVEAVFAVPVRGYVFAGFVHSGRIRVGQQVVVDLPDGPKSARVRTIDTDHPQAKSAGEGEQATLHLAGLTEGDLPSAVRGDMSILNPEHVVGWTIRSVDPVEEQDDAEPDDEESTDEESTETTGDEDEDERPTEAAVD
ncbi:MAG: hypothetical protein QM638_06535 [Nocardioides sp.]|uniref:hypothetical protein n=1 Tax=Nocardioides sp. TaxID=35761 RepID=UPI0039E71AE3